MISPVTYQGGKQRLADQIVEIMQVNKYRRCYDLCCGSGAVSLAILRSGYDGELCMIDHGPWGLFWHALVSGTFDMTTFRTFCNSVPTNPVLIKAFAEDLALRPVDENAVYVFLILQAASFGGKAVLIDNGRWRHSGFRDYWLPTATSNRRSPVNPMMPMTGTLFERVLVLHKGLHRNPKVTALCADVCSIGIESGSVLTYIDPPYAGMTEYGSNFDVMAFVNGCSIDLYVSESRSLGGDRSWCLSDGRLKGGISGKRKEANSEWLTFFAKR